MTRQGRDPGSASNSVVAACVLATFLGLTIFVPHEVLRPVALACAAAGALAVAGIRAYLVRLDGVARFLASGSVRDEGEVLGALLGGTERRLLGLDAGTARADAVALLRRRQRTLRTIALGAAAVTLCAGLAAVVTLST